LMFGVDPPLQLDDNVHWTAAVKVPVPSAMIGDWLVSPVRPPVMATVVPFSVAEMFVIAEPLKLSLNTNSESPPAPVSTNLFPLVSTTSKRTDVPLCVSVTVPKSVAVPHPPLRWHDVKVRISAWAELVKAKAPVAINKPAIVEDILDILNSPYASSRRNALLRPCWKVAVQVVRKSS
jgi:hypothetical protein